VTQTETETSPGQRGGSKLKPLCKGRVQGAFRERASAGPGPADRLGQQGGQRIFPSNLSVPRCPGIVLAVIAGMAKGTEAARVHQIVKHWRHKWEKYQARLRSGLAQVSVDLELDEVKQLQKMVEDEYHWGFLTCPEGIHYQVSLDGVWEEIPDPKKFDEITGAFKRSRMMYNRFKKVKGKLVVSPRTVQASRVPKKDRNGKVKLHKSGPLEGTPIFNERTPFDIIETGFPLYCCETLRRLMLRRGKRPNGTPTVEAEKWLLAELFENRKKDRDWLIKASEGETLFAEIDEETGQPQKVKRVTHAEIPFVVPHYDSGLLHETFSLYRVGADGWPWGRPQYGTAGREFVGWDSQVEAGVELDDWAKAKYEKDLERERDRHGDRGWIDAGLSRRMRAFVKDLCAREGCAELWDECCREYVDFVERRRELNASLIHARQALAADKKLGALSAKERDNAVELRARVVDLRRDLKATELPGGGRISEEDFDKLVAEFPLEKIARKVIDGVTTVGQIVLRLANSGLKGLVEFLRELFKKNNDDLEGAGSFAVAVEKVGPEKAVEAPEVRRATAEAPEAPEVAVDPIAKVRAADAAELAWLQRIKEVRLVYPQAPIGPELELFVANVERGVSRGSGAPKSRFEAGLAQITALGQWVEAEEARLAALVPPPVTSNPEKKKGPVFDPTNPLCRQWFGLASAVLEKRFSDASLPTRPAWIVEVAQWVAAEAVAGRFGSPEPARHKFAVTSTQLQVTTVLEGVKKLSSVEPALVKLSDGKSPDEAIDLAEQEDVPPLL
jgi:hypothetical protein